MPVIDGAGNLIEVAADPAVFGGQLSERGKQLVVRRCNSFCFYGIAAAIGLRHTNGNIGVTISNIRPECFSFSLPLLQFQKRFLASSAKND